MKIEMGESLLLSWLRHVKECQLVQTNWKPSPGWEEPRNKEALATLMRSSSDLFKSKYGFDLYGSNSLQQLIKQAEIDVLGISMSTDGQGIYAVDVAFHESGLNYGSPTETRVRILKKVLRSAMCVHGYLKADGFEIIFASPKINNAVLDGFDECLADLTMLLDAAGLSCVVRIVANHDFDVNVLAPVVNLLDEVADTSELFMRSIQLLRLVSSGKRLQEKRARTSVGKQSKSENFGQILDGDNNQNLRSLSEMRIGKLIRGPVRRMLESGEVPPDEVKRLLDRDYSKKTFDVQYPFLAYPADVGAENKVRYYSEPVVIYGDSYLICSQWFEVPANNDKPFVLKWISKYLTQE